MPAVFSSPQRDLLRRNFDAAERDDREPRSVAHKITKEVAAQFATQIAEELKKRLGFTNFDTAAFLNVGAKYPDYPFASYLTEMIDEQLYDFIRENYRAE